MKWILLTIGLLIVQWNELVAQALPNGRKARVYMEKDSFYIDQSLLLFPKYSIGWTPSALVNYFSGIQVSLSHGINKGFNNLIFEYAYLYEDRTRIEKESNLADSGFRLKFGLESFLNERNGAVGAGILVRHTQMNDAIFIDRGNFDERISFSIKRDLVGAYFSYHLYAKIGNWGLVRGGLNLGMGQLSVSRRLSSELIEWDENFEFTVPLFFRDEYNNPGKYIYPILGFHLNVSVAIN